MTEATKRRKHGCLTDCVAYWFNLHPENVPLFIYPHAGWVGRVKRFYRRRGYRARFVGCRRPPTTGVHIVIGKSWKYPRESHAVVYRQGRIVVNTANDRRFPLNRITHRLQVRKVR